MQVAFQEVGGSVLENVSSTTSAFFSNLGQKWSFHFFLE